MTAEVERWNVGWGLRAFMWACSGVLLTIGFLLASAGARTSDRLAGWVFLTVTPLGVWVLTIRPYVEKVGGELIVQNPVRRKRLLLADVRETALLNTGLGVRLSDGTQVVAWALQQGLLLTLIGRETRAVKAERLISQASRQARALAQR